MESDIAPDCPGFGGREGSGIMQTRKSREARKTKTIHCLEMALYQTHEIREARGNWHNSMPWGGLIVVSAKQNEKEVVHWRFLSCPCVCSSASLTLSHSNHPYISGDKKKRKETVYIFVHRCCRLSWYK